MKIAGDGRKEMRCGRHQRRLPLYSDDLARKFFLSCLASVIPRSSEPRNCVRSVLADTVDV